MKKLRAAFIGLSHVHVTSLARDFMRYPEEIELIGMADVPPYTKEELEIRIKLNVPGELDIPLWDDYKELLSLKPDIAIICTNVADHAHIVEETLALGIHTVVEKPMALSMEDAKRMYRADRKSKADLVINWPIAWFPAFRKAKEIADRGEVGQVLRVQYRSPSTKGPYPFHEHSSEELSKLWWYNHAMGGGSIADYAGYGCVLGTWITGKIAKKVYGIKKNFFLPFSDVEDYAVFTIDFGDAVGLIEGSWSTMSNGEIPTGPIIYGSEGVIVADRFGTEVKVYKDFKPYQPSPKPNVVYQAGILEENICRNTINHIKEKTNLYEMVTPEFNMRVMAAFDAGIRSCESGQAEWVKEPFQF